jgi:nicotinate phosphoribosyltransferase
LLEANGTRGVFKASPGKETFPGRKQVMRRVRDGRLDHDVLVAASRAAEYPHHQALLLHYLSAGEPVRELSLEAARDRCRQQLAALPEELAQLDAARPYRVEIDAGLESDLERAQDLQEAQD